MSWRVDKLIANSGDHKPEYSFELNDFAEIVELDDEAYLRVSSVVPVGHENGASKVFVPKSVVLELLKNAGWIES